MTNGTLTVYRRPTRLADLNFVVATEQHPDNRAFVGQWSRQEHASAVARAAAALGVLRQ